MRRFGPSRLLTLTAGCNSLFTFRIVWGEVRIAEARRRHRSTKHRPVQVLSSAKADDAGFALGSGGDLLSRRRGIIACVSCPTQVARRSLVHPGSDRPECQAL